METLNLGRKIGEDSKRWKNLPGLQLGGANNIVEMAILRKAIYIFNTIPIQISITFFIEIEKNPKLHMEPHNNNSVEGITIDDSKIYYIGIN